jgi:type IV pilus assembly protein PilC
MATAVVAKDTPYSWEGKDRKGNKVRGRILAVSENEVRADLRRQNIVPTRIRKQTSLFRSGGKISPMDIAIFSRQLATMLAAGIPLVQAFEIVGVGHEKPAMQKLILDIKLNIEGGSSLHESLKKHPLYFDDLYVNLVEAGEQAGALESLLDKVATYKEKTEALKKKIKKALFYPAAVLAVAVIVTLILLLFVIPQFEALFKGFGADLPAFTRMVIDLSQFVQNQGWWMGMIAGGGIFAFAYFHKRSRAMRQFIDRLMLRLPIIATRARCPRCSRPACRWSRLWIPSPARPATSSMRWPCCACATRSRPASACSGRWKIPACSRTWSCR